MRYIPILKFEGLNEEGLSYDNVIKNDVNNFINSFLFYSKNTLDDNGEINWMNISSASNARFVLSIYYNRELDKLVTKNLAEELKQKIIELVGLDQLLTNDDNRTD